MMAPMATIHGMGPFNQSPLPNPDGRCPSANATLETTNRLPVAAGARCRRTTPGRPQWLFRPNFVKPRLQPRDPEAALNVGLCGRHAATLLKQGHRPICQRIEVRQRLGLIATRPRPAPRQPPAATQPEPSVLATSAGPPQLAVPVERVPRQPARRPQFSIFAGLPWLPTLPLGRCTRKELLLSYRRFRPYN